jgi:hypothetical protein
MAKDAHRCAAQRKVRQDKRVLAVHRSGRHPEQRGNEREADKLERNEDDWSRPSFKFTQLGPGRNCLCKQK